MESRGWLERYESGEREQVWHEFRRLGDRVRDPAIADEVQAVCDEMARRARHNVETLSSWVRLVGDVWLVGTHPEWEESSSADPLVVEVEGSAYPGSSIRESFEEEFEAWQESEGEPFGDGRGPSGFVLPVAPDHLHKGNVSGGDPYGFRLPDATAEGIFVTEVPLPFVSYLNSVFRHGGFPMPASGEEQWTVTNDLAEGLLDL